PPVSHAVAGRPVLPSTSSPSRRPRRCDSRRIFSVQKGAQLRIGTVKTYPRGSVMKNERSENARLSRIETFWPVVTKAHGSSADAAAAARQLVQRYAQAVYRYLLGALRDADAADELTQEFALRFMRGALHGADPARGRFRDFVKGVLFHL